MMVNYPVPGSWSDFEDLCKDLFEAEFSLSEVHRYGKSGQRQSGIDILGFTDARRSIVGIQCKLKQVWPVKKLNIKEDIIDEINAASLFLPSLTHYYISTTADRDTKYNNALVEYMQNNELPFNVKIFCWDEINSMLNRHPLVARRYYPLVPASEPPPLSQILRIRTGESVFFAYSGTVSGEPVLYLKTPDGRASFFVQGQRLFFAVNVDVKHVTDPCSLEQLGHMYLDLAHPVNLLNAFTENKYPEAMSVSMFLSDRTCDISYVCEDNAYVGYPKTKYGAVYYFKGQQAYTDEDMSLYHEANEKLRNLFSALERIHGQITKKEGLKK